MLSSVKAPCNGEVGRGGSREFLYGQANRSRCALLAELLKDINRRLAAGESLERTMERHEKRTAAGPRSSRRSHHADDGELGSADEAPKARAPTQKSKLVAAPAVVFEDDFLKPVVAGGDAQRPRVSATVVPRVELSEDNGDDAEEEEAEARKRRNRKRSKVRREDLPGGEREGKGTLHILRCFFHLCRRGKRALLLQLPRVSKGGFHYTHII